MNVTKAYIYKIFKTYFDNNDRLSPLHLDNQSGIFESQQVSKISDINR